jgi:hypothetical protein
MYHRVRCLLPFDPNQLKRPANHPSFNEALNLRSRGQRLPALDDLPGALDRVRVVDTFDFVAHPEHGSSE